VIFIKIKDAIVKGRFSGDAGAGNSSLCGRDSISYGKSRCFTVYFDLKEISVMFDNKGNNRMSGYFVPTKPWKRRKVIGTKHLPILREASHTVRKK
jgi:hypothetical protein